MIVLQPSNKVNDKFIDEIRVRARRHNKTIGVNVERLDSIVFEQTMPEFSLAPSQFVDGTRCACETVPFRYLGDDMR